MPHGNSNSRSGITPAPPCALGGSDDARWFSDDVRLREGALLAYVRSRFPAVEDAENLVHEAYARLIRGRKSRHIANAMAFLYTTARNLAFDECRRSRVVTLTPLEDAGSLFVIDDGVGPADALCRNQELEMLKSAIAALPERTREVFTLRKLNGLSREEIARRMGVSESTINAQIAMGMLRCRMYFRDHGMFGNLDNEAREKQARA